MAGARRVVTLAVYNQNLHSETECDKKCIGVTWPTHCSKLLWLPQLMLDQDLPHAVYNSFCITHRHWPSSEYPCLHLCGQILVSFDLIVVAIVVSASSDSNLDSTREILIETHSSIQICVRTIPCTRISGIIACYSACMGQNPRHF